MYSIEFLCILAAFLLKMMGNFVWLRTRRCGFDDIVIERVCLGKFKDNCEKL